MENTFAFYNEPKKVCFSEYGDTETIFSCNCINFGMRTGQYQKTIDSQTFVSDIIFKSVELKYINPNDVLQLTKNTNNDETSLDTGSIVTWIDKMALCLRSDPHLGKKFFPQMSENWTSMLQGFKEVVKIFFKYHLNQHYRRENIRKLKSDILSDNTITSISDPHKEVDLDKIFIYSFNKLNLDKKCFAKLFNIMMDPTHTIPLSELSTGADQIFLSDNEIMTDINKIMSGDDMIENYKEME